MHALEQEKVGDLLEGDLLGDSSGDGMVSGGIPGGGSSVGAADLLGFDANPIPPPATDVFGGASASLGMANDFGDGGSADLLGFDGLTGGNADALNSGGAFSSQSAANSTISAGRNPVMPGYMGGQTNNLGNNSMSNNAVDKGAGITGTNNGFDLRPSVLTGVRGDTTPNVNSKSIGTMGGPLHSQRPTPTASNFAGIDCDISSMGAMGGARGTGALGGAKGTLQPELSEEAQVENSRKMHMAAGLFAGVVPSDAQGAKSQKKPIMAMGNNSKVSALDDLIPVANSALSSPPTSNNLAFGANDLTSGMPSSDPFGIGPMGGNTTNTTIPPAPAPSLAPPPPPASDPFGMGPMGGIIGDNATIPTAALPMAPPPPPMEPPPPVPSMAPPPPPPSTTMSPAMAPAMTPANPNNIMGSNNNNNSASVEEMQEMIKQQQAQMAQMMQMMQQMQMQGGGGLNNNGANNGAGGWP
mmetsp:Transcript_39025/g.84111  ORF Transcript_39025/g.84111 Transcript_39025/m.84111 type:complete len:469 (+) Transcript_39025:96-1502(+)